MKNTTGKPAESQTTQSSVKREEVKQVPEVEHVRKDEDEEIAKGAEVTSGKEATRTLNVQILDSQNEALHKLLTGTARTKAATVRIILDYFFLSEKEWLLRKGAFPDRLANITLDDFKEQKDIGNQ